MYGKVCIILAFLAVASHSWSIGNVFNFTLPCDRKEITGDIVSLGCIVLRLCYNHNQTRAQGFFDCYDQAPGKAEFLHCQEESFENRYLNTSENIGWACKVQNLYRLKNYASCLKPTFDASGVNQTEAVELVNKCQGKVLGLKPKEN